MSEIFVLGNPFNLNKFCEKAGDRKQHIINWAFDLYFYSTYACDRSVDCGCRRPGFVCDFPYKSNK